LQLVHRDVSPHNVLVTWDGTVKLFDFGIAKSAGQTTHTRTGVLKGNVSYMSPEQCVGETVDRRSDVFSLGILLWEMTLGRKLYRGRSDFEVMRTIVDGEVTPPRRIDPGYEPRLEEIVMRALAKEPE